MRYKNPIIPGFYPDPSICRVEEDYYLITSSFEWFPGLPIFHSQDLVNWRQLGHVLDRPSQLNLDEVPAIGGLYAPTIRYHQGTFYVVCTLTYGSAEQGNFIVTSNVIEGPWSEPVWIEDSPGIDPSLFFDDDGRCWFCGNRDPEGGAVYPGQKDIWLQELDLESLQLIGVKHSLWQGAAVNSEHTEAPHIYKRGDFYYLIVAEGGTGHEHAVTVARSEKIEGPYESCIRNPLLTHRHLGRDYPIVGPGHADIVQTQTGQWWLVCLGMRPYDGYYFNLGRETFLAPMTWEDDWPLIAPGEGRVLEEGEGPDLPEQGWPVLPERDDFDDAALAIQWNFLRTPRERFYSLEERQGHLRLMLRPETVCESVNPSFVGRRQQHRNFSAMTLMDFDPENEHECAGLVLMQNDRCHFRFVLRKNEESGASEIVLIRREGGNDSVLATRELRGSRLVLCVEAVGQSYDFSVGVSEESLQSVYQNADGRNLSTRVAGGFTGAYIGMYASSNGQLSESYVDFDWFEYEGENC